MVATLLPVGFSLPVVDGVVVAGVVVPVVAGVVVAGVVVPVGSVSYTHLTLPTNREV